MMGQLDTTPTPPHAVTMWATDHDIIVMLPMTSGGPPYLMKFALSEGGLMQALEVLKKRKHEVLSPLEAQALYEPPKNPPQVKVSERRQRFLNETTEAQRDAAQALLRKLGLVKS